MANQLPANTLHKIINHYNPELITSTMQIHNDVTIKNCKKTPALPGLYHITHPGPEFLKHHTWCVLLKYLRIKCFSA